MNQPAPGSPSITPSASRDGATATALASLLGERARYVFSNAPRNVYWETTIACELACRHCRASAIHTRDPREIAGEAAERFLRDVAELKSMLVLTGGDPLARDDIFELIISARQHGISVSITPSVTPSLTSDKIGRLKALGVAALGLSLDGPNAAVHDGLRGVPGTFERTERVLAWAAAESLPVQINTTVTRATLPHLPALYRLLAEAACPPVRRWSLFMLVPTGRGTSLLAPSPEEAEQLFDWVDEIGRSAPFHVSTVEAPSYRRHGLERRLHAGASLDELRKWGTRMGFGVRDGNGVVFVSHVGDVYPAGFLPLVVGNVHDTPLSVLYRSSPLLLALRDMDRLEGRCGRCPYRWVCGGSRARAFATTGNPLASDPLCAYEPGERDAALDASA